MTTTNLWKKFYQFIACFALIIFMIAGNGCGGGGTTGDDVTEDDADDDDNTDGTAAFSTIDELPTATEPVVSSDAELTTADLRSGFLIPLGEDTTQDFFDTGNGSYGACDMVNQARGGLMVAAQADMILCMMQQVFADNDDIYDGEYHAFGIQAQTEEDSPDHVKMKITRTGETITAFEMFACIEGEQVFYMNEAIDSSDFTLSMKGFFETGEGTSVDLEGSVAGTLDADGNFIDEKTIGLNYINDFGGGDGNFSQDNFIQTDDSLTYSGYSRNTGENTGAEALFSVVSLTDNDSEALGDWALGAGAAKIISDNNTDGALVTEAWDEDGNIDPAGDTDSLAEDPPETPTEAPTIAFTGSEVYNCGDEEETFDFSFDSDPMEACDHLDIPQDHIQCQDVTDL